MGAVLNYILNKATASTAEIVGIGTTVAGVVYKEPHFVVAGLLFYTMGRTMNDTINLKFARQFKDNERQKESQLAEKTQAK